MTYSSKLKIKKEHFDHIAEKIAKTLENNPEAIAAYESGNFRNSNRVKCLQTRFNYDILNYSVGSKWICDNLYPYMDDSHLKTALTRIAPKVEKKY